MDQPLSVKLASLGSMSQRKLKNILAICSDKKDLIIDPNLIKIMDKIFTVTWLKQNGIEKIYKMDPQLGPTSSQTRVYLIPSCTIKYRCVLDQIASLLAKNPSLSEAKCFHIIIIPRVTNVFDSILENRGLFDIVQLHSFAWELIALDRNLLSLEMPFLFKQLYVEHNTSQLFSISTCLWFLMKVVGRPKAVFSLGKHASSILNMMEVYKESYDREFSVELSNEIGALLVIDRDQDYVSSLLTPATYSGLLSELFNINCGCLDLNTVTTKLSKGRVSFSSEEKVEAKNPLMSLDSSVDNLYAEIRYRQFSDVLNILSSKAKLLKNEDIKALGIQEMRQYVATKLQQMTQYKQNLSNHVLACETILKEMSHKFEDLSTTEGEMLNNRNRKSNFAYVDEHFGTDSHVYNSLRLMCLLSLTQGLTYDEYNTLVSKYLLAFGHKFLYVFHNLVNAGLLEQPASPKISLNIPNLGNLSDHLPRWQNTFQTNANKLKQLPSTAKEMCPSYVFNGRYIPLVATICNVLLTSETLSDTVNKLSVLPDLKIGGQLKDLINGGMETLNQKLANLKINEDLNFGCTDLKSLSKPLKSDPNFGKVFPLKPKSVLVFVVGGVTYAEIAACEVVQTLTGSKIYIASDSVINGGDLVSASF